MSIRNFDALFRPKAIALVGASNRLGSVGEVLARNVFGSGFKGPVMPVNPHETAIRSSVNYRSVADLPVTPDLAVIATPAPAVPALIDELGRRGCRAAVVISTGFAEGTLRQDLLDAARPHLLRIVGPNCIGLISPAAGLNASFAHLMPKPGDVAFVSQSGTIAAAVLDWADVREIGFSHVVSVGDMSDVDIGDLLDYLAVDAKTRAILLYVESITAARKFMTAARIAARTKPVVVIKAGRGETGPRSAASRRNALAGSDAVYDAAFRRAGMLRVGSLRELFEAVATLASGIRPRGDRLAILTNGGGPGVLAADTLSDCGGTLARLSDATIERLDRILPRGWSRSNPVDLRSDAPDPLHAEVLSAILEDPAQDAVLVLNCPQAVSDGLGAAQATLKAARAETRKAPILTCWLGERAAREARRLFAANGIPTYQTPDESVRAFMQLVDYRRNQELLMETPPAIAPDGADLAAARRVIEAAIAEGRTVLSEPDSKRLLSAYGIPVVRTEIAGTPTEAAAVAAAMGFPVALKILSRDIVHKSEVGGVTLELGTPDKVAQAAADMLKRVAERQPGARIDGFTVQEMIRRPRAYELIAGVANDPDFGPVILFGQGGTAVEIIADRAVGLPPLNELLARDLIARTRVSRLLGGYSDRPAADQGAIAATLVTLSQMLVDFDEIAELDINPLLADETGVLALDARVVVKPGSGAQRRARFAIQPYPSELEEIVRSRGGTPFRLRPIRPEDEPALVRMVEACEPNDIRLRFFSAIRRIGHAFAARLTQIDYSREMAFVIQADAPAPNADSASAEETSAGTGAGAGAGAGADILGVARLIVDPNEEIAEFGIMVRSDQKGRGIGWMLMNSILAYARKRGFAEIYGEVLTENTTMLAMARDLGFVQRAHPDDVGLRKVVIRLDTPAR